MPSDDEHPAIATVLEATREALPLWVEKYVRVMDDAVTVPGTKIGVGLDPLIGFVFPGAGDAITGVGSIALLLLALREGVPTVAIMRMVLNIGVDATVGMLPFAGDVFDVFFRSNRRNLAIIEAHRSGEKPRFRDYVVVSLGVTLAIGSVVFPLILFWGVGAGLALTIWKLITRSGLGDIGPDRSPRVLLPRYARARLSPPDALARPRCRPGRPLGPLARLRRRPSRVPAALRSR